MKCPCGLNEDFARCCEPLLKGEVPAPSPERLMRSRYVAYATKNAAYIIDTTDPQRRHEVSREAVEAWMNEAEFLGLEILKQFDEGNKGLVEFIATYREAGPADVERPERRHHEVSRFRKQAGRWYFRQGKVSD